MWTALIGAAGKMTDKQVVDSKGNRTTALNAFHKDSLSAVMTLTLASVAMLLLFILVIAIIASFRK